MAEKQTKLSIIIRTVDKATAGINKRLDAVTKPIRDFRESLGDLREKSGLDEVIGGFKGVGGAIAGVLAKVAVVGGIVGGAVAGLFKLVDGFDELGDKAEAMGVGVDFLAQMRYAAERSGASVEALDGGLQGFAKSLGQARAGTGRMAAFLSKVSPALLRQLKAAKSNEEAFDLLAGAMAKLEDPAKRAALAQATLGDAALAPLLGKGPKGIKELRDRYLELAGSQEGAAGEAGKVDDAMKDLKASTDGIKAALVQGLAPALKVVVEQLRDFFTANRARIAGWAADLGKKLPGAVSKLVDVFSSVVDTVRPFVDSATKLKVVGVALAAIIAGPLVASIWSLGAAILATPVGWILAGIAAIVAGVYLLIDNWDGIAAFFTDLWDSVKSAFRAAWVFIVGGVKTVLGAAADAVMAVWTPVKGFFVDLWDGVTSAFQRAWDVIKGIIDKVAGAVETVTDAIDTINPFSDDGPALVDYKPGSGGVLDMINRATGAMPAGPPATEARITVDFANAPKGTRVQADPQSTASVDLSVGYQMLGGGL